MDITVLFHIVNICMFIVNGFNVGSTSNFIIMTFQEHLLQMNYTKISCFFFFVKSQQQKKQKSIEIGIQKNVSQFVATFAKKKTWSFCSWTVFKNSMKENQIASIASWLHQRNNMITMNSFSLCGCELTMSCQWFSMFQYPCKRYYKIQEVMNSGSAISKVKDVTKKT